MPNPRGLLIGAIALSILPLQQAQTGTPALAYASPGGNDTNDGLTFATAKLTVQAALDQAGAGGRVVLFGDALLGSVFPVTTDVILHPQEVLECASPAGTIQRGRGAPHVLREIVEGGARATCGTVVRADQHGGDCREMILNYDCTVWYSRETGRMGRLR